MLDTVGVLVAVRAIGAEPWLVVAAHRLVADVALGATTAVEGALF